MSDAPLPLRPIAAAIAGPLLAAGALVAVRLIDLGTPGVLIAFVAIFALIAWLYFVLRLAGARILADAVARPGTLVRWLIEKRVVNVAIALVAAAALAAHLLVFLHLVQPVFFLVLVLDALLVAGIAALLRGRMEAQFADGAARLVRELAVILLNTLVLFALHLAVDVLVGEPIPRARFDAAVAAANAERAGGRPMQQDSAQRPIEMFDDRLPLLVWRDVEHSSTPFRAVLRTARVIDLNVKSIRLGGGWGAFAYWIIYVVSLSFLPFLAITLLFRAVVRLPLRIVVSTERSRI